MKHMTHLPQLRRHSHGDAAWDYVPDGRDDVSPKVALGWHWLLAKTFHHRLDQSALQLLQLLPATSSALH